jgi:integrase
VQTLVSVIGEAERRGMVAQNVARGVRVSTGRRHKPKAVIPSKQEIREALAGAQGRRRALLVAAVFTGMRASELRGLRWSDVDFDAKLIRVRQRADISGRIGTLKSAHSRRDLPMSPMLVNVLMEWRLASPPGELVFPGRGGGPLCHNTLMAALGSTAHRYRHFYASWLIDQGFGPKRVQALMGHSSIQITFDVYGHLFPAEDDHARFASAELALVG